ncbi:hypothetical protein PIB30_029733 [Stylosanthes scabra]|uniref:Zinc knuckle CX2CX4HX4C n=1 Tax=Stylosanthes scabra TaxID=79078 RepID=A0ABU6YBY2_9FABA|nr:hypothetical protein [Stylosanthes scabra]
MSGGNMGEDSDQVVGRNKGDSLGEGYNRVKEGMNENDQTGMTKRVSFRDNVVGKASSNALRNVDSIDIDKLVNVKNGSSDSEVPCIEFAQEVKNTFSEPYKDVIIIKVRVDGFEYDIEYENLHFLCNRCNCFGYVTRECNTVKPVPMDSDGGAKEQATISISPVQPSNSKLRHSDFEFGKNDNNDNNRKNDSGVNGSEEKPEDMLQADLVFSDEQEKEWTEVQRKGKKKINPDNKKPNSKKTATEPSTTVQAGWVGKSNKVTASWVGRPMPNRGNLQSRDTNKVTTMSSTPATSTPAPLHPHKRRRPPSLQNSPTEKELENEDETLKLGVRAQPLTAETTLENDIVRHGGGPVSLSSCTGIISSKQGNSSAFSSAVYKAPIVDQGKDSVKP